MQDQVDLHVELRFDSLCHAVFMRRVVEEDRQGWAVTHEWTSDQRTFLDRFAALDIEPITMKREYALETVVFPFGRSLVLLQNLRGEILLRIAGSEADAAEILRIAKELVPLADERERVPIAFWFWQGVRGTPNRTRRLLHVPRWREIEANYCAPTRSDLDRLITEDFDPQTGQLALWFGEPGCGKTYALRSLMREWRQRFTFHYISDVDRFFANSDYMLSVLLEDEGDAWKLVILEDAGEFLVPDARREMGQGLSRLLNASDGLIGQGLKTIFLLTTNEEIGNLHPAVARPGRCASQIEFHPFGRDEAQAWLRQQGSSAEPAGDLRLADLYALKRGEQLRKRPVTVGFH